LREDIEAFKFLPLLGLSMARKRKKEAPKKEEYKFVPPEFDEKEFIRKDIRSTKTLLVTVVSCVIFAIIGYFAGLIHFALGFVVLFVGILLLRFVYRLARIPAESLETKTSAGNYVLFFLLFLGLWILFLNPPFSDHTEPFISDPSVWVLESDTGEWVEMNDLNRDLINTGEPVNITAKISDNGQLDRVEIKVHRAGFSGEPVFVNMTLNENGLYEYNCTYNEHGTYLFTIRAVDRAGNVAERGGDFLVN